MCPGSLMTTIYIYIYIYIYIHTHTTVYSKPTDSHLYLHVKSCHTTSSIRGIQRGVALCLECICSTDNEYSSKSIKYHYYLNCRGHDPKQFMIFLKNLVTHSKWCKKKDG